MAPSKGGGRWKPKQQSEGESSWKPKQHSEGASSFTQKSEHHGAIVTASQGECDGDACKHAQKDAAAQRADKQKVASAQREDTQSSQQPQQQGQVSFDMSKPLTIDEVRIDAGQGDERAAKEIAKVERLAPDKQPLAMVAVMHRLATLRGRGQYLDPNTGFMVFTATFLKQRPCCNLGCRHCPHLGTSKPTRDDSRAETCGQGKAAVAPAALDW